MVKISNKTSTQDLFSFEIFFFQIVSQKFNKCQKTLTWIVLPQEIRYVSRPSFPGNLHWQMRCFICWILPHYRYISYVGHDLHQCDLWAGQDRLKDYEPPKNLRNKKNLSVDTSILWYELVWDVSIPIFILIGFFMMRISSNTMDIMWHRHEGIHQLLYQNKAFVGVLWSFSIYSKGICLIVFL